MTRRFPQWRFVTLSIATILVVLVLLFRIVQVQIIRHEAYLAEAKKQWHEKLLWQARRGQIFDRNGLPLAVTQRSYSVGVTAEHFPRDRESITLLSRITGVNPGTLKRKLAKDHSYVALAQNLNLSESELKRISSLPGITIDQQLDRLYPFGAISSLFLGSVSCDGLGSGGVEDAFQGILGGTDGWLLANKSAKDSTYHPVNAPGMKPKNGRDLYLTIDSRVQSIVDFELSQAVDRYGAAGGVAIVLDPRTGDILGMAEELSKKGRKSSMAHKDALYSVSCIFEPGSTFKLITYSYLLEKGDIDPYDVYYGENGEAHFSFGTFKDDHEFEWLTFKEAFVFSSNICTIKAVMDSDRLDFYSYILRFGFGGWTGITLPAESRGTLSEPHGWSARSLPSIAIGQEIGVTAIQMAMAYCALANGGRLLVPRIALEVRDGKGCILESHPPVTVRRVFSSETAAVLKDFCREVVERGTGTKAAVRGIPVAGKTGTAQKAGPNGYEKGRFIASFIGFAPADDPRAVCLVLLDEPSHLYHWGGESAAIVFSKIIEGINLATDILYTGGGNEVALGYDGTDAVEVPSFLRLSTEEALQLASRHGLRIRSSQNDGVVYSQIPDPGTFVDRGGEVKLLFTPATVTRSGKVRVPDLAGLSIREARRLLIACGLRSRVEGYGIVTRQSPPHGRLVKQYGEVVLYCSPKPRSRVSRDLAMTRGDRR